MKNFRVIATTLAVVFSITFAFLLFPEIVGVHGVAKSAFFVGLGVVCIWLFYFMLGRLFSHIYDAGKEEASENNTDFI
jgi:hypothetical protein